MNGSQTRPKMQDHKQDLEPLYPEGMHRPEADSPPPPAYSERDLLQPGLANIPSQSEVPPTYLAPLVGPSASHDSSRSQSSSRVSSPAPTHNESGALLPCVIPQVGKSFKGAFYSPFARAYPTAFSSRGIQREEFLAFVDGFNEAFMANPILQLTSTAGNIIGMFNGAHGELAIAGMAIQGASEVGINAIAYIRSKKFMKAANADIFHPAGLHAQILTTKKMCAAVDYPESKLQLLARDEPSNADTNMAMVQPSTSMEAMQVQKPGQQYMGVTTVLQQHQPAIYAEPTLSPLQQEPDPSHSRGVRALGSLVQPLEYNVPVQDPAEQRNLLKRLGERQAKRSAAKQEKRMNKRRDKCDKEQRKADKHADKETRKMEKELYKLERELRKKAAECNHKLGESKALTSMREREKVERDFEKERAKIDREVQKVVREAEKDIAKAMKDGEKAQGKLEKRESKTANKVRWIVISEWDEKTEEVDSSSQDDEEEEEPVQA